MKDDHQLMKVRSSRERVGKFAVCDLCLQQKSNIFANFCEINFGEKLRKKKMSFKK
jgi:hypothetical protein